MFLLQADYRDVKALLRTALFSTVPVYGTQKIIAYGMDRTTVENFFVYSVLINCHGSDHCRKFLCVFGAYQLSVGSPC